MTNKCPYLQGRLEMKLLDLMKFSRSRPSRATIISDGCRDYVVEVQEPASAGLLRDRRGRVLRFKTLRDARDAVRDATAITLSMRVAADEACCGGAMSDSGFSRVTISRRDG